MFCAKLKLKRRRMLWCFFVHVCVKMGTSGWPDLRKFWWAMEQYPDSVFWRLYVKLGGTSPSSNISFELIQLACVLYKYKATSPKHQHFLYRDELQIQTWHLKLWTPNRYTQKLKCLSTVICLYALRHVFHVSNTDQRLCHKYETKYPLGEAVSIEPCHECTASLNSIMVTIIFRLWHTYQQVFMSWPWRSPSTFIWLVTCPQPFCPCMLIVSKQCPLSLQDLMTL